MTEGQKIAEASEFLRPLLRESPPVGVVLGSGLASVAENLAGRHSIPYSEIPHWPTAGVKGHPGNLTCGIFSGTPVLLLAGRVHLYEGYSPDEAVFGVRVLSALGVRTLVLTNAAGGIREGFEPGTLALITDHINLQFASPLVGEPTIAGVTRFVDLTNAYDPGLREIARKSAAELSLDLKQGIYAAVLGPQYETPAEVRFLQTIGADMVGMSTVLETIAARQLGMRVLAISVITNRAASLSGRQLSHEEVLETGAEVAALNSLLEAVVPEIIRVPGSTNKRHNQFTEKI